MRQAEVIVNWFFIKNSMQALHRTSNAESLYHGNAKRESDETSDHKLQSYNSPAFYRFRFLTHLKDSLNFRPRFISNSITSRVLRLLRRATVCALYKF